MRIDNVIYFSPNYKINQIDFNNKDCLINAYDDRINNFYFQPIEILNENLFAFAAGALILSCIDSIARYTYGVNIANGVRIKKWLIENVHSIDKVTVRQQKIDVASDLYNNFRNGLVHEARIKQCGQFSYEKEELFYYYNSNLIVNPKIFYSEVKNAFNKILNNWKGNPTAYKIFNESFSQDFYEEINKFKSLS